MKYAKFTKPLTVALENEIYQRIKAISDERRISMAEWVREILTQALVDNGCDGQLESLTYKNKV
jgi:hypothetical protein